MGTVIRRILEAVDEAGRSTPRIGEPRHDVEHREWPDDDEYMGGEEGNVDHYYWPHGRVTGAGDPEDEDHTFVLWSIGVDEDHMEKGYGRAIMQWFRNHFERIDVINIVEAHDFWNKMLAEGLVDELSTDYQTDSFWHHFFDEG